MTHPTVTIGFTPRERFHLASKSLQAIFKHTNIPFNLIVVDCNTPERYLSQMKKVLSDRPNVKIIHTDHFLQANTARNLVLRNTQDEYVAFVENDCIVSDKWLEKLVAACEETNSMVAIPLLLEGPTWKNKVHHDTKLAHINTVEKDHKTYYELEEDFEILNRHKLKSRISVESIEMHTMLFKRKVFDIIGNFDEQVLADTAYVDISIALTKAKISMICEPLAVVNFYSPPPVQKAEMEFFKFVWNLQNYIDDNDYLANKWNIINMHDVIEFVQDQQHRTDYYKWATCKGPKKIKRVFAALLK